MHFSTKPPPSAQCYPKEPPPSAQGYTICAKCTYILQPPCTPKKVRPSHFAKVPFFSDRTNAYFLIVKQTLHVIIKTKQEICICHMAEACLEDCENHFGGSCINMQACVILWLKSLLRLRVVWMAQIPVENSGGVILLGTKDAVTCRVCYIHIYKLFLDLSRWTFHILYIHYYLDVCTHLTMYSPKQQMSQLVIIPARALPPCNHDHWMIVFEALWYTNSYVYVNLQSHIYI